MSDIFNHSLDAYESELGYFQDNWSHRESSMAPPDPLFYHQKLEGVEVVEETTKAMLLKFTICNSRVKCWYPKSWVKLDRGDVYLWKRGLFLNKHDIVVEEKHEV